MKHCCLLAAVAVSLAIPGTAAVAQPKADKADKAKDSKVDAKSLMASGLKLLDARDYLGALAVFRDAYARFASPKILLNIGTTLKLLERNAEAANTYQRYLDDKDADKKRVPEVQKILAGIDKTVGTVELVANPPDLEVQYGDDDWMRADDVKIWRVPPGKTSIKARKEGFKPDTKIVQVAAGEQASISLTLAELPKVVASLPIETTTTAIQRPAPVPEGPRSRIGALVGTHVDALHGGGAALIGATADVIDHLEVQLAVMLGPGIVAKSDNDLDRPKLGGFAGISYSILQFLDGKLAPLVAVGLPVFVSNGARYSLRAAAGVEYTLNRHLALILELGGERTLNPENDIRRNLFVPSLTAVGRL